MIDTKKQWNSTKSIVPYFFISSLGINVSDIYLSLNASRMRKTSSNLEYKEEDNGASARAILQHNIATQAKTYINGHPEENKKIISQSMQALTDIALGSERDDAIENIKTKLNLPVLSYETYKNRNQPTNPNGILCNGRPDLTSGIKDLHFPALKFAKHKKLIEKNGQIPCYQYDLCMFCKKAQLVDDPYIVYKLLSFIDALADSIVNFPEREFVIEEKISQFKSRLLTLPLSTLEAAKDMLNEKGRYFMFISQDSVIQYL